MPDWSYSLTDLILFSEQTYFGLFDLSNSAYWPLPAITGLLGIAMLWLLLRGGHGRLLAIIMVAAWGWVAWHYHLQAFTPLHWPAVWYALMFALQAIFLLWEGVIMHRLCRDETVSWAGISLLLLAVIVSPLLVALSGRDWMQAEVFGMAPDPTAIATMGLLLMTEVRHRIYLFVIPALWCLISAATLHALDNPQALLPLAAILIYAISRRRTHSH